tara:strand:- start:22668 stop:23306 length:639 start_codon:yes stop_codon:yes gene_type:complete
MKNSVILLGAGGHGEVVLESLQLSGIEVIGICDPALGKNTEGNMGLPILDSSSLVEKYPSQNFLLANGVGFMPGQNARSGLFLDMKEKGYSFMGTCHPTAIISKSATINESAQLMAGSIIQSHVYIGENTIINTAAQVDHGSHIASLAHICPGAILSGDVQVGESAFIGAGAVVSNGVKIGKNAVIGAGAIITKNVPDNSKVITPITRDLAN